MKTLLPPRFIPLPKVVKFKSRVRELDCPDYKDAWFGKVGSCRKTYQCATFLSGGMKTDYIRGMPKCTGVQCTGVLWGRV